MTTSFVNSSDQLADVFTKSLRGPRIKYISNKLGAYDLYVLTWGGVLNNVEGMSNGPSSHSPFHVCIIFLVQFSFLVHSFLLPFWLYSLLYIYIWPVSILPIQSIRKAFFSYIPLHLPF